MQWCIEKEGERDDVRGLEKRHDVPRRKGEQKEKIVMECGEFITSWLLIIQSEMTHKAFLSVSTECRMR